MLRNSAITLDMVTTMAAAAAAAMATAAMEGLAIS